MYEFQTPDPILVSVRLGGGAATITAEERDTTVVTVEPYDNSDASRSLAESTRVAVDGGRLIIHAPESSFIWRRGSVRVTAQVPLDSGFECNVASAETVLAGRWSEGTANSASGNLQIGAVAGNLKINTASGDVRVHAVGRGLNLRSASGNAEIGSVGGDASLTSASGDLAVHDTGGSAMARTASGDIELFRARQGEVRAQTASGDVQISVLPGTGVYLDVHSLSGYTQSDLSLGDAPPAGNTSKSTLSLRVHTASGDVAIMRAQVAQDAA
ncbi:DUF4097 family beta strand repeat-containing protein [Virgisporangium ochraceum]|uniref:DUF4097 domain-containing protein n=1 Tax=Virgisporangium ochraceum TaxID=65505 RepID=A0A8J4ECB0_9ACTN|nr:DUF4097 family beta strand repeat-containing protein [Virgisporangium ochraceum]GIJ69444.1 hypothetical protein Voc01_043610 [Virgisporangium ochraceum]